MVAGWKSVATWRKFVTPGQDRDRSRRAAAEFNNRMNLTRSAQQTDRRGPCRLSACYVGLMGMAK